MAQYYGVTRSGNELSHYGVKGMKWGVRKAILTGNERALNRHYRKAAKKLAKLTDIGLNSKKYAAKAAAYGAAAAGTGTLAVGGTGLTSKIIKRIAPNAAFYMGRTFKGKPAKTNLADFVDIWGKKSLTIKPATTKTVIEDNITYRLPDGKLALSTNPLAVRTVEKVEKKVNVPAKTISNNTLYRAGAGLATAGLGAKSIQNAYRASHGAKYRAKAQAWKNEMDQAFKGTQYEGHYEKIKRKRRKRN